MIEIYKISKGGNMGNLGTFFNDFIDLAEKTINELEKTDLTGKDKKTQLDITLTTFCEMALAKSGLGLVYKFIIRKWVLPLISNVAQRIYDLLIAKIEGKKQ